MYPNCPAPAVIPILRLYISYVRGWKKNEEGGRGISSVLATKLEQGMKKPKGWMDKRHRDETQPASGNKQTVDSTHSLATDNGDRIVSVTRNTKETQITITINLDGSGQGRFDTGVPF